MRYKGDIKQALLAWRADPVLFVREALQVTNIEVWQEEALNAIAANNRVAIRSGHGVGKSAMLAWVVLWWLSTRLPAKIACTAPTAHQLEDVLWGEIGKWIRQMPDGLRTQFHLTNDRIYLKGAAKEGFAVARTARKEQPEAFQGFHSEHMLFIGDEASGIEDIIFEVGQGAMSTPGAKTLLTGNPTKGTGYFANCFGTASDKWYTMTVSSKDSTQVADGYADEVAEQYGANSNVYRVRVLGLPPVDDDDSVISTHMVESACSRGERVLPTDMAVVWGLDVARFGDDRTSLAKRKGNVLIDPVVSWSGKDLMQTVGLVVDEWERTLPHLKPSSINVDVIGLGSGVVDRLKELGFRVRGINVAESPAVKDGKYMRLRDELWFKAREWFHSMEVSMPRDDKLIAELTSVKYAITSAGRIKVESKDDMKKRGMRSPDLADAFCLTFGGGDYSMNSRADVNAQTEYDEFDRHSIRGLVGRDYAMEYNEFGG